MLGNLSIRSKLILAVLLVAAAGAFVLWKGVVLLHAHQARLGQVERIIIAEARKSAEDAAANAQNRVAAPATAQIERAVQSARQASDQAEVDFIVLGVIALGSAVTVSLLLLLVAVVFPIGRVTEAARNLARGDLWTDLPDDRRRDDAGGIAGALKGLKRAVIDQRTRADLADQKIQETIETYTVAQQRDRAMAEEIKAIAEQTRRDADQRIAALELALREAVERHQRELRSEGEIAKARRERLAQMSLAFERSTVETRRATATALSGLGQVAVALARSGQAVAPGQAAAQASIAATELALQKAGRQADALGRSIHSIVEQARGSTKGAAAALGQARSTDLEIQALAEAAQRIGDIVGVIHAIASQTHLLALNASIEASRAGAAGRGFQVVAGEVKGLADQTARATDQVTRQITAIQERVARSVEAIRGIGDMVGKVAVSVDAVAAAVEQEGVVAVELGQQLDQAAAESQSTARAVADLGEVGKTIVASARAVHDAAATIEGRVKSLESDVARYLEAARTA